jgi:hypothetical protein
MRYNFLLTRITTIKHIVTSVVEAVEKWETSMYCYTWFRYFGR